MDFDYENSLLNLIKHCKSNRIQAVKHQKKKKSHINMWYQITFDR